MSSKIVEIPEVGVVTMIKSSRSKSIKLSISEDGKVRVSMPHWTPYAVAMRFAVANSSWIVNELSKRITQKQFSENQKIGKLHHLQFERTDGNLSARVTATKIIIKLSKNEEITDASVQERTNKAVIRALKKEVEQLLRPRTKQFAETFGFSYSSVGAKLLKRRWGSCDNHKSIIYNCFLMELPWDCIDYVILHELTHTEHMNHGEGFKARLHQICPRSSDIKRQMKQYRPILQT